MPFRYHPRRTLVLGLLASFGLFASVAPRQLRAQDDDNPKPEQHGRKYKAPPDTSHIEVTVLKGFNKKPIDGAHVIFHPVKDGIDEGNLEVKTHPDGKVSIDVIPTGSKVTVQVLADGFATYAEDFQIDEATRQITVEMIRPRAQVSTYVDNQDKPSQIQPGIQQPIRPKKTTPPPASSSTPDTPAPPDSSSGTSSKPQ
jgi:hypothetical protein